MRALRLVPVGLSFLLLAAHFLRASAFVGVAVCLFLLLLLAVPSAWSAWTLRLALVLGGLEWVRTLVGFAVERRSLGEPWLRMALILGAVALFTGLSALAVRGPAGAGPPGEEGSRTG